mgnify:FL=1
MDHVVLLHLDHRNDHSLSTCTNLNKLTLQDYIGRPRKEWTDKDWFQEAQIMVHSPWIDEEEREYWKDKIKELRNKIYTL